MYTLFDLLNPNSGLYNLGATLLKMVFLELQITEDFTRSWQANSSHYGLEFLIGMYVNYANDLYLKDFLFKDFLFKDCFQ